MKLWVSVSDCLDQNRPVSGWAKIRDATGKLWIVSPNVRDEHSIFFENNNEDS